MGKRMTQIIKDYKDKYIITYSDGNEGGSIPQWNLITIPAKYRRNDCDNYLFVLLHEIGHCETFDWRQTVLQKEFYATQWAIDNAYRYNVNIDSREQRDWQEYINSFIKDEKESEYLLRW